MASVNIYDAKTQFSKLVKRARAGEVIIIADAGVPVAKLVPFENPKEPRVLGADRGKIWVADDTFSAFTPEEIEEIVNNPIDPTQRPAPPLEKRSRPAKRKPSRAKKR